MKKEIQHCLTAVGCRTYQVGMKLAYLVLKYRVPECLEGPGSVVRLPGVIRRNGFDKVLVVTDDVLLGLGLPNRFLEAAKEAGIRCSLFHGIERNPTVKNVEDGFRVFREDGCQAIVAFGGGAPMDCAKAIAARAAHPNKTVPQLIGMLTVLKRIPMLFAVPTTAGTGSETTVAALITDEKTHRKASINDFSLIPHYAVLDPELTVGLPPIVTATTGMDALCHAVESYINILYCNKNERQIARESVKLIYENLLRAYRNGGDLEARQNMQKAAFGAGRAFTRGGVGYVHAVGHTLGGLYGTAHGMAMSIIMPHVLRQFGPAIYPRLAELAEVCGLPGNTQAEKAEAFLRWIEELKREMGIPEKVRDIREQDIPQIIRWARKEAHPLYPVPVIWEEADFETLISSIRE